MEHHFNIDDAKKYGVECAVLLYNFRWWLAKNKANNKHFYEGRYWTYNSVKAFGELFPYLSNDKVRRCLEKLEKSGEIVSGNFNKSHYDRTKWYSLNDQMDLACVPNGNGSDAEPIPYNKPDNKTDIPCGFSNHETDSVKYSKETKSQSELLSKTNKDDLDETTKIYFDIAIGFQRLFIHNKKQLGLNNFKDQENATFKSYVEPIRLAFERDGRTRDDFASVFNLLKTNDFWIKNIMSTSKLRDKMERLLIEASDVKKKPTTLPSDWFSRELTKEQIELLTDKQKKSWEHNKSVIAIEGGYLKPIIK